MIKFAAFMHLKNIIPLNRKMKEIIDEVNALREEVDELKSGSFAVATGAESETTSESETVELESSAEEGSGEAETFDWETSDDVIALKKYSLDKFGKAIKGNKRAETVREEIKAMINSEE